MEQRSLKKYLRIQQLLGKEVVGNNGWLIGKVDDAIFNDNSWQIEILDIKLKGNIAKEFDMKKPLRSTHVRLNVSNVQGIGDHVALKTTKEDLFKLIATHAARTQ